MAVTISIELTDAEFVVIQEAYASMDTDISSSDITASVVKAKLINELSTTVGKYDKAKQAITYSTFSPS